VSVAAFISSQRADHHVPATVSCRALGVSQSWYYKWRDRPPKLVHRRRYATRAQARAEVGAWISSFYNARRRHSACGGLPPIDYETLITAAPAAQIEDQAA
jgi:transposase InsO family protein